MVCVGFKSALTKDPEDLDHDTVMKVRHYFICNVHMNRKQPMCEYVLCVTNPQEKMFRGVNLYLCSH